MKSSIKKVLRVVFTISLAAFMLLGAGIVIVQVFSLVTMNGALSVAVTKTPKRLVILFSAIAGFAGFIYSYIKGED